MRERRSRIARQSTALAFTEKFFARWHLPVERYATKIAIVKTLWSKAVSVIAGYSVVDALCRHAFGAPKMDGASH